MRLSRRQAIGGAAAALVAGAAPRAAWGRTHADVAVIGAGLAGLHAASLLERAGLNVLVIEAEDRVGGRLHTLDDLPGRPEAGGIQVGSGYRRLRAIASTLGVGIIDGDGAGAGIAESGSALYRIRGQTVTAENWASSTANLLAGAERAVPPGALQRLYAPRLPRLARPADWMEPTAWPADISYAAALRQLGASDEALRLIDANLNGNRLEALSTLYVTRTAAIYRAGAGPIGTISGGSQRLPEAMATALRSPIRLKTPMAGLRVQPDRIEIGLVDGNAVVARYAICTLPFSALQRLPLSGPIDPAIRQAISSLPYTRASFAYLQAREPFWRSDGLPATLWTDDPTLGRLFVLGDEPAMLKLWTTGEGADLLDGMSDAKAAKEIVTRIEAARPSARGQLRMLRRFSWQRRPTAGGIYRNFAPAQAPMLAAAARAIGRRLHFAGEHLAWESSGMEGALESGERAAQNLLSRSA